MMAEGVNLIVECCLNEFLITFSQYVYIYNSVVAISQNKSKNQILKEQLKRKKPV